MIFNSKSFKFSILLFCLSAFFTNQLFCSKLKDLSYQEYYKEDPWKYLEKKFIDIPKIQKCNKAALRFLIFTILATTTGLVLGKYLNNNFLDVYVFSCAIGLIILLIYNAQTINSICSIDINALKIFLSKYNPILKKDKLNTKYCLPKKLYPVFDSLYERWLIKGDLVLKKEGPAIINLIREKIIFQINPEKYNKRTIRVKRRGLISKLLG